MVRRRKLTAFCDFAALSAAEVIIVAEGQEREHAYWLAGKYNADNCDALLAIWDGEPQSSACGTEAVVTYARSIGKETVIFS